MHAYLAYSIAQTDAHLVESIGRVIQQAGTPVEYWMPNHTLTYSFDKVAKSSLFVGVLTASSNVKSVLQLYENAKRLGIMALLLAEKSIHLPSKTAKEANVLVFQRFQPQHPIRFVETKLSWR